MSIASLTQTERAERRKEMAEAVKTGKNPLAVARKYKVGLATVRLACKEFQVPWPLSRGKERYAVKDTTLNIIADLISGMRQADIARKYGLTRARISDLAKKGERARLLGKNAVWKNAPKG